MDCLVTKLKGSVNDLTIPRLGCFIISGHSDINSEEGENYVSLTFSKDSKVYIDKGNTNNSQGSPIVSTTAHFNVLEGDFVINIEKYNLTKIELNSMYIYDIFDIDILKYSPELINVKICNVKGDLSSIVGLSALTKLDFSSVDSNSTELTGDISLLAKLSNLENVSLNRQEAITGNIASIGSLTKLKTFNFGNTSVTGNIEDFVKAQRAAGRTEATMDNLPYLGACAGLKFNGNTITNQATNTLSWTSTTITLNSQQITA